MTEEIQPSYLTEDDKRLLERWGTLVKDQGARKARQEVGKFLGQASVQGRTRMAQGMLMMGLTASLLEKFDFSKGKQQELWRGIEAEIEFNTAGLL